MDVWWGEKCLLPSRWIPGDLKNGSSVVVFKTNGPTNGSKFYEEWWLHNASHLGSKIMSRISRNGKSFCWCTGCTYLFGGPFLLGSYRGIIKLLTLGYSWLVECQPREKVWVRWREVPCSVSAEYLSHTGFRLGRGWHQPFQKCHCVNICEYVREACPKLAEFGWRSTQLSSETDINRTFFIPESAPKRLQVTQVAWYLDTVCFLLVSSSPC